MVQAGGKEHRRRIVQWQATPHRCCALETAGYRSLSLANTQMHPKGLAASLCGPAPGLRLSLQNNAAKVLFSLDGHTREGEGNGLDPKATSA